MASSFSVCLDINIYNFVRNDYYLWAASKIEFYYNLLSYRNILQGRFVDKALF